MARQTLLFHDYALEGEQFYMADLKLTAGERTNEHAHCFYEFHIAVRGEFAEVCNGVQNTLKRGTLHFLRPEDSHFLIGKAESCVLRNIAIEKNYFEALTKRFGVHENAALFHYLFMDELAFAQYLQKTDLLLTMDRTPEKTMVFESIVYDCLIGVLHGRNQNPAIPAWLKSAYEELAQNDNYIQGMDKLLALCQKSQEHITREFRKHYGLTPSEYINNLRLKEAARRLCTTEEKIISIAFDCGFHNISYFNRAFLSKYQVTPKNYREKNHYFF